MRQTIFRTLLALELTCLLLLPATGVAQDAGPPTSVVSGTVTDARTGSPIPGAIVAAQDTVAGDSTRFVVRTDATGRYEFTAILWGTYHIRVSATGFRSASIELDVASQSAGVSIGLEPDTSPVPVLDTVVVTGLVLDAETSRPLFRATVEVEGSTLETLTDADGRYRLVDVPPGPQVIRARLIGYAPNRVTIVFSSRGEVVHDFRLAANPLVIEGLVVTADALGRAAGELGTASVIDREAIAHQTATSLAGILELVPGVPVTPPGLDGVQQIALRAVRTSGSSFRPDGQAGGVRAQDLASFGTLIIVDGIPASNNANLQTLGPLGELGLPTSASGGIDLRQIPAATLERVEVIRGVPSARWGDFTQGAIVVETRAGAVDPEIKGQLDARTAELSIVGGRALSQAGTGTLTFDFASTRTAPGRADDYAYRVAAQGMHRIDFGAPASGIGAPKLRLDTRVNFYQLFDDRPVNPRTGKTSATRVRNTGLTISERATLRLGRQSRLRFTGALTTVGQDAFTTAERSRTAMPFTDRLTEGRQEGKYVIGPYTATVDLDGRPWSLYGRFEWESPARWLGARHDLRSGLELRREWNNGPGYQFDIEFPPQVLFNGVNGYDRPRRYDDLPPLVTTGLYVDDRIYAPLGNTVMLQLQAGLRLDLLHQGSTRFSGVRDYVWQPRLNAELGLTRWLRLRAGWGLTAKTPPLSLFAPPPQYYDVVNVNYFTNDPVERLAVLTTFIRDPTNDNLGFAKARKLEGGIELGLGAGAISVVVFDDRITNGFGIRPTPLSIQRDIFTLTDSTIGNGIKPDIILPPERTDQVPILLYQPDHVYVLKNTGVELTAFLPEIPAIRTRFTVTGQWIETRQENDALYFGSASAFSAFQLKENDPRTPYWAGATEVGRRVLMVYRIVHHQPKAGLVISVTIQHNVSDEFFDIAGTDTLAFEGYLTRDGTLVPVPVEQRGEDQFRDLRLPRSGLLIDPSATGPDWLLSLQVSKTLPFEGRMNFWAFNAMDRRGLVEVGQGVRARPYPSVRVGIELMVPLRGIIGR